MPAIRLHIDTDVCGDDFESARKMVAAVLDKLPNTHGMTRFRQGAYVRGFDFDVDTETFEVNPPPERKMPGRTVKVTLDVDEGGEQQGSPQNRFFWREYVWLA
jgi:hypothetical protein